MLCNPVYFRVLYIVHIFAINKQYMPRADKNTELSKWVTGMKSFGFKIKYPTYEFTLCVLAPTETDARIRVNARYNDATEIILFVTFIRTEI